MTTSLDPERPRPRAASFSCPSCGAAIALQTQGWAASVACASCASVLDASDPNLRVLQEHASAMRITPRIPLGARGTWHGVVWEIVGFQQVTITVEEIDYSWTEYVCFNPYRGFLYLSEYEGHWNVIEKLRRRPVVDNSSGRPVARFDGRTYKHFQMASARTTFAIGEFPWELRVGDSVVSRDYVDPPYILSAEASDGEVTWSRGTYTPAAQLLGAFKADGKSRPPVGVFANQPNPHTQLVQSIGRSALLFLTALMVMLVLNMVTSRNATVFEQSFTYDRTDSTTSALVTPTFELTGRPSRVEVGVRAEVDNDWVFFNFALINEQTGDSREFDEQVSYYRGTDSDGSWSEGGTAEKVHLSSVPPGRYFLRIAPEGGEAFRPAVNYRVTVKRDVPSYLFYVFALMAVTLPALLAFLLSSAFESRRWAESDYAPETSSSDDDE